MERTSKRKSNPGLGRAFNFFGKFRSKILAARSEREHPGSFIIQRGGYYYVLKEKTKRRNPAWKPPFAQRKRRRLGELYSKAFQKFTKENPGRGVLIYGRVLKIFARKTSGPYKGQDFVHTFKPGAIMVGMPDGSLRIVHPK